MTGSHMLALAAIVLLLLLLAAAVTWGVTRRPRGGPDGEGAMLRDLSSPDERGAFIAAALLSPDLDPAYAHWLPTVQRRLAERREGKLPMYMEIANYDRQEGSPRLVLWEDKIVTHRRLEELGLPHAAVYYAGVPTREELVAVLKGLPRFVAKPTHLSRSACVHICDRGRDPRTGEACAGVESIADDLLGCLAARPINVAGEALHQVTPQILVEEYVADPIEVKFTVVWGRVATGKVMTDFTRVEVGVLSRRGIWGPPVSGPLPRDRELPPHYGWMVDTAEQLARGTDLLRVDFLCGGGRCVVGYITPPPSNSRIIPEAEALIAQYVLDGHEIRGRAGWKAEKAPAGDAGKKELGPAFAHFSERYAARARLRAEGRLWGGYKAVAADRASENHPAQLVYEDKLLFYRHLDARNLPHPRVFSVFEPPVNREEVLLALEGRESFALKPTHLASGKGVVLWDHGHDLYEDVPLTLLEAADRAIGMLDTRLKEEVTEALGWVPPRLLLEELIPVEFEVKWMTFWGRPLVARIMFVTKALKRQNGASAYQGLLFPDGTYVPSNGGKASIRTTALPLPEMLATAAAAAEGTDHLRVDLMVYPGGFTVGECAVFTEPPFFHENPELEALFAELLLTGHAGRPRGRRALGSAPGSGS